MAQQGNYHLLIQKLDQFIRKYYVNQTIRGLLYTTALLLVLFLGLNFLEHYFYFDSGVRKAMFYSFVGASAIATVAWILMPLAKYLGLGSVISHEQAAGIIGDHFGDVKDQLLNVLQLKGQAEGADNQALILASIDQKSENIRLVPFKKAIDLSENRKYLRYVLPPLLLLLIILFAAPSLIKDSTARLINNDKEFERPAPFHFIVEDENMEVVQFDDYPLMVKVEGDVLPNEVFIDVDNYQYRLTKEDANTFSYRFSNVQKDTEFKLLSSGVSSEEYELAVLKKPNILDFEVNLDYPNYTRRPDEALNSVGDIVVPLGTNINWVFDAQNTDAIDLKFTSQADLINTKQLTESSFSFKKKALKDEGYKLFISNSALPNADSISYSISVIPDQYPSIKAERFVDSTNQRLQYFVGDATDDYGLLSLAFNYRINNKDKQGELQAVKLPMGSSKQTDFEYQFDLDELGLKPGDEVVYYFEVYDNDAINGSKSARTNLMQYAMPTLEELEELEEQNEDDIKDELEKSIEESKKLQEDVKKMEEKLLQKKELDWQDKKELEKLLERQQELQKNLEKAQEKFEENMKNQEEFQERDEELVEKQEKIQELFEEVMSDEMKELMEKIQELMQEMEKDEALEKLEQMEMNDEEMEMELDRMLELFKQMELEQEMEKAIDKMEEIAEKEEELAEETQDLAEEQEKDEQNEGEMSEEEEQAKQEELQEKQEEIQEDMKELEEKMEEIEQKNQELERPQNMDTPQEEMQEAGEQMEQSQEQMEQQENKKASESQQKAAEQMRQAAQKMSQQMQSMEMEQMEEDMQALRQLLENLVGLSFDQEELMETFGKTTVNTPRYVELVQEQFKLKDDFRLIEDSLQALSKRVFQIEAFVTEKVTEIKDNMESSIDELEERRKPKAAEHQQRAMKNVNDLALILGETMQQMQQQMAAGMPGSQSCQKPGGKNPSGKPGDKMSKGQQGLNKQMQQMKQAMEEGGKGGSAKEFAEMAARQAALRKALKEKQKQLQEQGQGSKELQGLEEQMNKVETDLVNKRLTNEMLQRQEEILTRLLEHEKAEREKEYDNKRKAERTPEKERTVPPSLEEYLKKREAEVSPYQTVSPNLKPYYKNLVEKYLQSLKAE